MVEWTLTDKSIDRSREIKKEFLSSSSKDKFERLCSMEKIVLADFSDSLIVS